MLPTEAAALEVIRALYEEPIIYTGAGLAAAPIAAIPTDDGVPGQFASRNKMFAIAAEALPDRAKKGDTLEHGGIAYRVIQASLAVEVGEWQVFVEKV